MSNIESVEKRIKNWQGSIGSFGEQTEEMKNNCSKLEKEVDVLKKDIWSCEERLKNQNKDMKGDKEKLDKLTREIR